LCDLVFLTANSVAAVAMTAINATIAMGNSGTVGDGEGVVCAGFTVGVGVAVGACVGVGVGACVGVAVGTGVGDGVGVAVGVGEGDGVGVGEGDGEAVGVGEGDGVGVGVGVASVTANVLVAIAIGVDPSLAVTTIV
jgi:hypothetical protein